MPYTTKQAARIGELFGLFDCSPQIAAKLERCEAMAASAKQSHRCGWTYTDAVILNRQERRRINGKSWLTYLKNLNT